MPVNALSYSMIRYLLLSGMADNKPETDVRAAHIETGLRKIFHSPASVVLSNDTCQRSGTRLL